MANESPDHRPLDVSDSDSVRTHYVAIRDWLLAQSERDIIHHLPNLVETITDGSEDPDTVRFVGGVSFTQKHTPLDYRLDRVYAEDDVDFYRRESLKLPISQEHHYVRFVYPPDPDFGAKALRSVLLTSVESTLYTSEQANEEPSPGRLSRLWPNL